MNGLRPHTLVLAIYLNTRGFDDPEDRRGNLRTNAVTRNECDSVRHVSPRYALSRFYSLRSSFSLLRAVALAFAALIFFLAARCRACIRCAHHRELHKTRCICQAFLSCKLSESRVSSAFPRLFAINARLTLRRACDITRCGSLDGRFKKR